MSVFTSVRSLPGRFNQNGTSPAKLTLRQIVAGVCLWPFGWLLHRECLIDNRWVGQVSVMDYPAPEEPSANRRFLDFWKQGTMDGQFKASDLMAGVEGVADLWRSRNIYSYVLRIANVEVTWQPAPALKLIRCRCAGRRQPATNAVA